MKRSIKPEILDTLSPEDPAALHNRRDLRIINGIMGNYRWFARILPKAVRTGEKILELGSGTGELGRYLARRGIGVDGLDLWPRPAVWSRVWHRADLLRFDAYADYPVVIANLILHQFADRELEALGARLRRTARVIAACEPRRSRISQAAMAMAGPLFGANDVTRHDARVSIAAGFRSAELPHSLGLDDRTWIIRRFPALFGAYRMLAVRRT